MTGTSRPTPAAHSLADEAHPQRRLSLGDTTLLIVGIVIGSGLYETTPLIAANVPSAAWLVATWLLGGAFALTGALCYAELATTYPADGGDYVYLSRAWGRGIGFLFAWAQLWVVRPGSIGAMAYVFGRYATQLYSLGPHSFTLYAASVVAIISGINILGVREGKWTQNLLSVAKLVGLAVIVAVGLTCVAPESQQATSATGKPWYGLALILIVFTYGGWNDMAYVAAEVREPQRNILRALLWGVAIVVIVYVGVNVAFLHALGLAGVAASGAVAAEVAELGLGEWGRRGIALLICVSTLGAINGMVFTGARIYYAMGQDHRLFARIGRWNPRFGTPVWSLSIQAGTTLLAVLGCEAITWGAEGAGFQQLIDFTTPVFWIFLLLSGISLFLLRQREPDQPRPFRVPLYPLVPLVFCCGAAGIVAASVHRAIEVRSWATLWGAVLMAPGIVFAIASHRRGER